jgi:hypothetical protein
LEALARSEIEGLQDFHVFTGYSYDSFRKMVAAGHLTGSVTNSRTSITKPVSDLASILLGYLDEELPRVVIYQVVSHYEWFFFEFLALLLQHNPHALPPKKQITIEEILAVTDRDALITKLIEKELHELKFSSVEKWFQYLDKVMRLEALTSDELARLAELKATRDVVAHNAGVANDFYVRKAGRLARARAGEHLGITRPYIYESADFLKLVVSRLTEAVLSRLAKPDI